MSKTNQITRYLKHAAELWSNDGPTGKHVEVLTGEIHDAGGNTLFTGSADECVAKKFRIPTKLVPTTWNKIEEDVVGADHIWQLVIE